MVAALRWLPKASLVMVLLLRASPSHGEPIAPPHDATPTDAAPAPTATSAAAAPAAARPAWARVDFNFGKGLQIVGTDGRSALQLRGFIRARQTLEMRQHGGGEALVRNAQLRMDGQALKPGLTWRMQVGLSPSEMGAGGQRLLQTALVRWTWPVGISVAVGRGKVPFGAQRLAHSSELQLSDLSVAVQELHLDRTTGLFVNTSPDKVADIAGVFAATDPGGLLGFRARLRPLGAFDDTVEGDVERIKRLRIALAGSVALAPALAAPQVTRGSAFAATWTKASLLAVDFTMKYNGFSAHAEWLLRQAERDSAYLDTGTAVVRVWSRSAYGAHLQLGQMVSPWLQVAARMARLRRLGGTDPALVSVDELAVGVTAHFAGNDSKLLLEFADRFTGALKDGDLTVRGQVALFW